MRFKRVNGQAVPFTPAEEAARDAEEAAWAADTPAREAADEERRKEGALLNEARLLWVIETLVGELEAIRRGDPPTARAVTLRNKLDNL